ncbi:MAG: phage holin family protein [Minisyncoccia bacterium]
MWFLKFILAIIINFFGLIFANQYISGFVISNKFEDILFLSLVLTILNFLIRPILKLILSPIIFLTFGLGILVVNGLILYWLDIFSKSLNIQNISALIYGTLIFSILNFIYHRVTKKNDN